MKTKSRTWSRRQALLVIFGAALILCALIIAIADGGRGPELKTNEERVKFLAELGWDVDPEPVCISEVTIPLEFSDVYKKFNELQIEQGYNLSEHRGEKVLIYAYRVKNYDGYEGPVVAELYIAENHLIGGDIHSLALNGFMHSLKRRPQT
ncbi:MAG: DUF4830 domain-containing protein [Oscillospiraceae bacterium]